MKSKSNLHSIETDKSHSIISGTLSLTLSTVAVKLLGVLYKVPLSRFLGDEGMGYFNSAYTVYTFFYLLCTAGVPKAVMIIISEARASNNSALEKKIIRVAISSFFLLGIAATVIFSVLSAPLAKMIGNSRAAYTMLAVAPSIIFISIAGVVRGVLSAHLKFSAIAVSQVIEGVARLGLGLGFAVFAINREYSLPIVSALTILGATFGAFLGLIYLLAASKIKISPKNTRQNSDKTARGSIMRRILSISLPITVSAAVMSITGIIDLGQIMRVLTSLGYSEADASALYGNYTTLAVPVFNLAIAVIAPVSMTFLPVFTKANAERNPRLISDALKSSIEMSSFLSAPLVVGIMCYSREILGFLFGQSGLDVGAPLLVILIPSVFFMSQLLIINSLLEALGKAKIPVLGMILGSIVKIFVSRWLLSNPELGIVGAPIGTVLSYAVAFFASLWYTEKKMKISVPVLKASVSHYFRAAVAILPTLILQNRLSAIIGVTTSFIITVAVCAILYFLISFMCGVFWSIKNQKLSKYTNLA